ncbi:MAG: hypothetical protein ABL898_07260 [Hyphomicrobiaceae bacterium]|nr:hypothetical protein [Hyphomicrobiaceae bacterium]
MSRRGQGLSKILPLLLVSLGLVSSSLIKLIIGCEVNDTGETRFTVAGYRGDVPRVVLLKIVIGRGLHYTSISGIGAGLRFGL